MIDLQQLKLLLAEIGERGQQLGGDLVAGLGMDLADLLQVTRFLLLQTMFARLREGAVEDCDRTSWLSDRRVRHAELPQRVLFAGYVLGLAVAETRLLEETNGSEGIPKAGFEHAEVAQCPAFNQRIGEFPSGPHALFESTSRECELP